MTLTAARTTPPFAELPAWAAALRDAARRQHDLVGLPGGKEEAWRFTQIQPVLRTAFAPADGSADGSALAEQYGFGNDAGVELVFVNGQFVPHLSHHRFKQRGFDVMTLAQAAAGGHEEVIRRHLGKGVDATLHPFANLNSCQLLDGAFVHISRNSATEQPVHLLFISIGADRPVTSTPRVLVVIQDNVEATIVESYVGEGSAYFTNAVTEIVAGQDCRIDHCKLQIESMESYHVALMDVKMGRKSRFVSHSASLGGRVTRNDLVCHMSAEAADATLNGLVLIDGEQHCDNHTLLDHAAPNCPSHELYKHVLGGKSSAVFKGKIYVAQIAQKTDSKQTSKALLMTDDANMNSQPALEIYADDVKCTHGSTIGPIDDDMLFYLRTRGIDSATARHLLTYAFAADITRRIRVEPVRRRLEDAMAARYGLPQDLRINDLGAYNAAVL